VGQHGATLRNFGSAHTARAATRQDCGGGYNVKFARAALPGGSGRRASGLSAGLLPARTGLCIRYISVPRKAVLGIQGGIVRRKFRMPPERIPRNLRAGPGQGDRKHLPVTAPSDQCLLCLSHSSSETWHSSAGVKAALKPSIADPVAVSDGSAADSHPAADGPPPHRSRNRIDDPTGRTGPARDRVADLPPVTSPARDTTPLERRRDGLRTRC
jgi:hypothetical protein